jgi:hypothetical protein
MNYQHFNIIENFQYLFSANFLIPFSIFIFIWIITWIFSKKISEIIIGDDENNCFENINYNRLLSVIIILLSIYYLINGITGIIDHSIYILMGNVGPNNTIYINYNYIISSIISNIFKTICSIVLLILRKKILEHFEKI